MAVHYRQKHLGETANLKFELIKTESNAVLRKIYEAFYICKEKPIINDKSEVKILHRFLVQGDVILTRLFILVYSVYFHLFSFSLLSCFYHSVSFYQFIIY